MHTLRIVADGHPLLPTAHGTETEAHQWLSRRASRHGFTGSTDDDAGGNPATFSWTITGT